MLARSIRWALTTALIGAVVALLVALASPKIYEGRTTVVVWHDLQKDSSQPADPANVGAADTGIQTELLLLQSEDVFDEAVHRVALASNNQKLEASAHQLFGMCRSVARPDSKFVEIRARAFSPLIAADLANAIASVYNDLRLRSARLSSDEALKDLKTRLQTAKKTLLTASDAQTAFMQDSNVANLDLKTQQVTEYAAKLQESLDGAQAELRSNDAAIVDERSKLATMPKTIVDTNLTIKSSERTALEAKLGDLQKERVELLKVWADTSKKVKDVDFVIANIQTQLTALKTKPLETAEKTTKPDPAYIQTYTQLATNETRKQSLLSQISQTKAALQQQNALIAALPKNQEQLANLQRDAQFAEQKVKRLQSQIAEVESGGGGEIRPAKVLYAAKPDRRIVAPDQPTYAAIGSVAGLFGGFLLSLAVKPPKRVRRTTTQLADRLGLPVATSVPQLPGRRGKHNLSELALPECDPQEGIRYMAFVMSSEEHDQPQTVLFTGVGKASGCSGAAGQFALSLARTGVSTLLVDCNLRSPSLTKAFACEGKSGVGDMLSRTMLPSEEGLAVATNHDFLKFLPAGAEDHKGLGNFLNSHVAGMLEGFRERAQYIVLDTPPCDVVSDAARLAKYADTVCLVVSATAGSDKRVPQAHGIMQRAGAKKIEVILTNAVDEEDPFGDGRY